MLTAKEFAAEAGISYPIIIRWLKEQSQPEGEQRLPGAKQTDIGRLKVWQIPASLVARFSKAENKPRKGRPPKTDGVDTPAKPAKKPRKKKVLEKLAKELISENHR